MLVLMYVHQTHFEPPLHQRLHRYFASLRWRLYFRTHISYALYLWKCRVHLAHVASIFYAYFPWSELASVLKIELFFDGSNLVINSLTDREPIDQQWFLLSYQLFLLLIYF